MTFEQFLIQDLLTENFDAIIHKVNMTLITRLQCSKIL